MAKPKYGVFTIALATAHTSPLEIVPTGTEIDAVTVVGLGVGVAANLIFGANSQEVPVSQGDSWEVSVEEDGCLVPLNEGLFMTNPAGAGNLVVVVSFGKPVSGLRTLA